MYNLMKFVFVIAMHIFVFMSCRQQASPEILSEQAFEDVLLKVEKEQKYLCVLLIDSTQQNTVDLLKNQLTGEFKSLSKR